MFKRTAPARSFEPHVYRDFSHLYNKDNDFGEEFFSNLEKTIAWTESIVAGIQDDSGIDNSKLLRTINPSYEGAPFYRYEGNLSHFNVYTPDISFNYIPVLAEALSKRQVSTLPSYAYEKGQVLEFDIDVTTHDGAPSFETNGFIDESDIPPIDTWFYLTKSHLYCWIPTQFIEIMQRGIDVEILDSYRWIKDSNPQLQAQILPKLSSEK